MKRLIIKRLIVISQSESRSLEIPFSEGLNIICGGNKTGKSSIIKSIFTSFGCECKRVEKEWQKLISEYLIFFNYGDDKFCVVRQNKRFQIFQETKDGYQCVIETESFHEYSNCLMNIFNVNMPCVAIDGKTFNLTPPLLFRFQYIDQDEGWNKIADSFTKIAYIKDWKSNTNKYVSGYLNENYYSLKSEITQLAIERDEKKRELSYNQNFVSRISETISQLENNENMENVVFDLENLIADVEEKRKHLFNIKSKMSTTENEIFVNQHKLHMAKLSYEDTKKDIDFAIEQNDELICPTCNAKYANGLKEQLDISSDFALSENLISSLNTSIITSTEELEKCQAEYNDLLLQINNDEKNIQKSQELLSYSEFFKNKGQYEIYESCQKQLGNLQEEFEAKISEIAKKDERANDLKSNKRSKEIREQIESYCRTLADTINIPKTFIKLRDFVQVIDRTGSETPRLVYMYQSALYLYNLNRLKSPFNFFVIDTPNQQGQDDKNLESIYKSFELFLSNKGQVILGTERTTGLEDRASTVLTLTEKRRCLNNDNYDEHISLLEELKENAIKWVSEDYKNKSK